MTELTCVYVINKSILTVNLSENTTRNGCRLILIFAYQFGNPVLREEGREGRSNITPELDLYFNPFTGKNHSLAKFGLATHYALADKRHLTCEILNISSFPIH